MRKTVARLPRRAAASVLLVLSLAACGGGKDPPPPNDCRDILPASCPNPRPSYSGDAAPLLRRYCGACHTAGGIQDAHPFDTYEDVQSQATGIRIQVDACIMPPADQPQPTGAERRTILGWIVCGAVND